MVNIVVCLHFSLFRPNLDKRRFWTSFVTLLAPFLASFGLPGAPQGSPWGPEGVFGTSFSAPVFHTVFCCIFVPPGSSNPGGDGRETGPSGDMVKHHFGTISSEIPTVKQHLVTIAFSSPVRRGELLRGKVSQGSTSPLKAFGFLG